MDKITLERIADDADKAYPFNGDIGDISANEPNEHRRNIGRYRVGYIAGATAENDRAQKLADALETLKEGAENHTILFIDKALKQWKDGKGKEVEKPEPLIPLAVYKQQGSKTDLTNPTK